MLKDLGEELKRVRDQRSSSLQAVAEPAKISPTYLQKLERGVVDAPSPHVLGRLAKALDLSYLRLMELAGYLDEQQLAQARSRTPKPHPLSEQNLSPEEWRAVGAFIQELKAQRIQPGKRLNPKRRKDDN